MVVYQSFYCIFFPLLEAVMSRLWVPQTTDSSTSVSRFLFSPDCFSPIVSLFRVSGFYLSHCPTLYALRHHYPSLHGKQTDKEARRSIKGSKREIAAAHKGETLIAERGESCEPATETYCEKQFQSVADTVIAVGQTADKSDDQTPHHIHHHRGQRKRRHRMFLHEPRNDEPRRRPESTSQCHNNNRLYHNGCKINSFSRHAAYFPFQKS